MIEKQIATEGEAYVSTVLFSNESRVLHDRVNIRNMSPMKPGDFTVGGSTALIDAIGGAIHHIGNVHKYAREEDVPEHTIFVIITDGKENASHHYTAERVKQMIEKEKSKYGWEFLFLGANIDAAREAARFGIGEEFSANYHADHQGTAVIYKAVSEAVCSVRASRPMNREWKRSIDEDYEKRGKK